MWDSLGCLQWRMACSVTLPPRVPQVGHADSHVGIALTAHARAGVRPTLFWFLSAPSDSTLIRLIMQLIMVLWFSYTIIIYYLIYFINYNDSKTIGFSVLCTFGGKLLL